MTTETTTFDYAALGDLAGVVKGIAERMRMRLKRAADDIVEIGESLSEARGFLKTGEAFDSWLSLEFDMSRTSAYRFIAVANRFRGKLLDGGICASALYALSSPDVPDEVVDKAAELANEGVAVTRALADELIDGASEEEGLSQIETDQDEADCDAPDDEDSTDESEEPKPLEPDEMVQPTTESKPAWWRSAMTHLQRAFAEVHSHAEDSTLRNQFENHVEDAEAALDKIGKQAGN